MPPKNTTGHKGRFSHLELDVRSISMFRIVLGCSLLFNLIIVRWSFVTEVLGKDRIIPYSVMQKLNGSNSFSLFDYVHNNTFAYFFMVLAIVSAALYTIGFKTRIVSWITLLLYWNIMQATSSFCFGFDFYTFQLLFWSCFLPLDNFFAISKRERIVKPYFPVAFVLLFQITCVYFFTGLAKYGMSWKGGYAIHNMLMDTWSTNPVSAFLIDKPFLYRPLTYTTLCMDYLFPILLFLPSPKSFSRYLIVCFLFVFHLSIVLMYNVGNFSYSGFAVAALLIPSHFWDKLLKVDYKAIVEQPLSKWVNYVGIGFSIFAIYVITVKNLVFCTKYTAARNWESIDRVKSGLNKVDIPSPVKVSFFLQHWKMFAPNPPAKLGWLTLEVLKDDGYNYDFMTNELVTDVPTIYWNPSGYEGLIMKYARNYSYPTDIKFKTFLKYWIPYKIQKINPKADHKKILFVDYSFFATDQSVPYQPPLKKTIIPIDSMMAYKPFGK